LLQDQDLRGGGVKETSFLVEDRKGDGGQGKPGQGEGPCFLAFWITDYVWKEATPGGAVLTATSGEAEFCFRRRLCNEFRNCPLFF